MNTNTTLSTPKVRDGLKKDGSILITKRGYIMWLKKLHDESQWQIVATISRYSTAECPLGKYCQEMGTSIWQAPKWAQKVRDFYADDLHGMQYTAIDCVYHMVKLYGYKCSDIFNGTEEKEVVSAKPIKKQPKTVKEVAKPVPVAPVVEVSQGHADNPSQEYISDFAELSGGIVVHRYNIVATSFVGYTVYEPHKDHNCFTYDKKYGCLGDITTRPVSQDIEKLRLGSKERFNAVDNHYATLRALKSQYVHEAFGR